MSTTTNVVGRLSYIDKAVISRRIASLPEATRVMTISTRPALFGVPAIAWKALPASS